MRFMLLLDAQGINTCLTIIALVFVLGQIIQTFLKKIYFLRKCKYYVRK